MFLPRKEKKFRFKRLSSICNDTQAQKYARVFSHVKIAYSLYYTIQSFKTCRCVKEEKVIECGDWLLTTMFLDKN